MRYQSTNTGNSENTYKINTKYLYLGITYSNCRKPQIENLEDRGKNPPLYKTKG